MITVFSTPRPFKNEFKELQLNSINSFLSNPEVEVILFDDEEATTSAIFTGNKRIKVVDSIEYNENRTPMLGSIFNYIRLNSSFDIVVHINTDILIDNNFSKKIVQLFSEVDDEKVFISGQRYNVDLKLIKDITFSNLYQSAATIPMLHGKTGLDYWAMHKTSMIDIPNFNCGRPGIDSYLCYKAVVDGYKTVDCTYFIKIFHQNHPYPSKKKQYFKDECLENIKLAGGYGKMMSLRNFQYLVDSSGHFKFNYLHTLKFLILNSKIMITFLKFYRDLKNA